MWWSDSDILLTRSFAASFFCVCLRSVRDSCVLGCLLLPLARWLLLFLTLGFSKRSLARLPLYSLFQLDDHDCHVIATFPIARGIHGRAETLVTDLGANL